MNVSPIKQPNALLPRAVFLVAQVLGAPDA
jgi:hypothetical protein